MKTDNELKILLRIKQACENMCEKGYKFQEYENENSFSLNVKEKKKLFTDWYSSVSDVLGSILKSKHVFGNNLSLWDDLKSYASQNASPPQFLNFAESDDISLERVIRIARNYYEHPDKHDQEKYVLLADYIPNNILMQTAYKATQLVKAELEILTVEEIQIMIGENMELKRRILEIQETLKQQYIPLLEIDERFTLEMQNTINEFLVFVPSKDNVNIVNKTE